MDGQFPIAYNQHRDYKALKSLLISGQLVKKHLVLISVHAYKADRRVGVPCSMPAVFL